MGVEKEGQGARWEAASKQGAVSGKEREWSSRVEHPTHHSLLRHSFPRPETSGMGVTARLY